MNFDWKGALAGLLSVSLTLAAARADDAITASISDSYVHASETSLVATDEGSLQSGDIGMECCADGAADPFELIPETCSGWKIGGWTQIGYNTANSLRDGFNQYADHVALHQQWLYAEKAADGSCGWDWGFRMDYVYGTDGQDTQAFGGRPYDWDNGWDDGGYYGHAIPWHPVQLAHAF
ncbi:MAG: porin, partial [Planctomycetes bacterium]|nr:porin [Planctomycetota bacterium]